MKDDVIICRTEEETASAGAGLAGRLRSGDAVLLLGEMGAGKSVFARGLARAMGVTGAMPSPTFMLMLPYNANDGITIYHMDLYRLDGDDAFYTAGLADALTDGIALVEWAERCPGVFALARRVIRVRVDYGENERERLVYVGADPSALLMNS
jgi:tRNA threonylcarbamoyl adenosine modification protein YjeE